MAEVSLDDLLAKAKESRGGGSTLPPGRYTGVIDAFSYGKPSRHGNISYGVRFTDDEDTGNIWVNVYNSGAAVPKFAEILFDLGFDGDSIMKAIADDDADTFEATLGGEPPALPVGPVAVNVSMSKATDDYPSKEQGWYDGRLPEVDPLEEEVSEASGAKKSPPDKPF